MKLLLNKVSHQPTEAHLTADEPPAWLSDLVITLYHTCLEDVAWGRLVGDRVGHAWD